MQVYRTRHVIVPLLESLGPFDFHAWTLARWLGLVLNPILFPPITPDFVKAAMMDVAVSRTSDVSVVKK